jgi:hypothetical protein
VDTAAGSVYEVNTAASVCVCVRVCVCVDRIRVFPDTQLHCHSTGIFHHCQLSCCILLLGASVRSLIKHSWQQLLCDVAAARCTTHFISAACLIYLCLACVPGMCDMGIVCVAVTLQLYYRLCCFPSIVSGVCVGYQV